MMKSNGVRRFFAACLVTFVFVGCIGAAAMLVKALWPSTGEDVCVKGDFTLDVSHASEGYIMAKREACSSGLKMRISKGNAVYTYDLNNNGEYEVFPLQMGSGTYQCSLYRNVKSNKFSKEAELKFSVELNDDAGAFLYPSQYVYYTPESLAVQASMEICEGLETDEQKLDAIIKFVSENFAYDYDRARSNPGFYLGDVDGCYETRTGLCQDLAAMTACMLRVQGIPTQLVIGYANKQYHAWNSVLVDGEYQLLDITAEVTGVPASVYTVERYY